MGEFITQKEGRVSLWAVSIDDVFRSLDSRKSGLSHDEAARRLLLEGHNQSASAKKRNWSHILLSQFSSPLTGVLIFAAVIALFLGEKTSSVVIILIIILNSLLGFFQEARADRTVHELEKYVKLRARVMRDGRIAEIDAVDVVVGDVVKLELGDIIPADIRLFEVDDLTTDESSLTGESNPVLKKVTAISESHSLPQYLRNMAFSGTSVATGAGIGVVTSTGRDTFFGKTVELIEKRQVETGFHRGLKDFGTLTLKIVLIMTVFIFTANTMLGKSALDSFLFALAIAVGMTPEVLPIIITVTLSHGAMKMAKQKVIVKNLSSVESLGNIDFLCCDKTGTLTEGSISLSSYVNASLKKDEAVMAYGLICNSAAQKSLAHEAVSSIDTAIWEHSESQEAKKKLASYKKITELPFDFTRKRMSVLVKSSKGIALIAKGAPEKILSICAYSMSGSKRKKFDKKALKKMHQYVESQEAAGYRVIAIADKVMPKKAVSINEKDEKEMTLCGFMLFLDPPKSSAKETLAELQDLGIKIKVLSGDSALVTKKVCVEVGLEIEKGKILLGDDIDALDDASLGAAVSTHNVFARVSPEHKHRIVVALQKQGHEVGFLGDGINDAPALKAASVGITVNTASGIAKESSDIILLKKGLKTVADGVKQGRMTFGNITKYIMNTISANYGNMITVALSSLFLKFIPLLPAQILLNNFMSDIALFGIPSDEVDKEFLRKPKKWNIRLIEKFMIFFGLISTFFDILLILMLIFFFHADIATFRTAWFIESLISEILVTFAIRTRLPLFKSRPGRLLLWLSTIMSVGAILITYSALGGHFFEFVQLPWYILTVIVIILLLYFVTAEAAKHYFFRKQGADFE